MACGPISRVTIRIFYMRSALRKERGIDYAKTSTGLKLRGVHICVLMLSTPLHVFQKKKCRHEWFGPTMTFVQMFLILCVADILCAHNHCYGGTCWENINGTRQCQCAYGYTGVHCESHLGKTAVNVAKLLRCVKP